MPGAGYQNNYESVNPYAYGINNTTNFKHKQTKKALCIFLAVEQRTGRQTKLKFHLTKPKL